MIVCVSLPDYGSTLRAWSKQTKNEAKVNLAKKAFPRPWIAKIKGNDFVFVKGHTDYIDSNGDGSKNVLVRFYCEINEIYLISHPMPKGGARRYRGRINPDGTIQEIYRD